MDAKTGSVVYAGPERSPLLTTDIDLEGKRSLDFIYYRLTNVFD